MTSANVPPDLTLPQPINRQCLSIRLLRAIFSPFSVHEGVVSLIVTSPPLTAMIVPPVCEAPMLTNNVSPTASFDTFAFLLSSVLTPNSLRSRNTEGTFRQLRDRMTYEALTLCFDLDVDRWAFSNRRHNHSQQSVRSAQRRVD